MGEGVGYTKETRSTAFRGITEKPHIQHLKNSDLVFYTQSNVRLEMQSPKYFMPTHLSPERY